jgi:predicted O-linked N-acetylglucosamine transferase (SPINDLY family)
MVDSEACYKKALELRPGWAAAHSNLLLLMNYTEKEGERLFAAHKEWARRHCVNKKPIILQPGSVKGRRIRIGYISPDFKAHSVAYFMQPVLECHDRTEFEIFCYADVLNPDLVTGQLKSQSEHWRNIRGMEDKAVAELIRDDSIDILVDLAGHTAGNRLPVFCMKPAPVQVTYLGYPNTTGMETIDYRLTDCYADPEHVSDAFYAEKLVRLPHGFICYSPPLDAPSIVLQPPRQLNGYITFGSFNNLSKITPEVVAVWSRLMEKQPDSRMFIKNCSMSDPRTCERYKNLFSEHGIQQERLQFMGHTSSLVSHLVQYARIDIALDTFPYNGTTTTCEALWMGVPVVTMTGDLHAGRVGASIMNQAGLDNFVGNDVSSYIGLALGLAADVEYLAGLRRTLRETLSNAALCNAGRFVKDLEDTYCHMLGPRGCGRQT